MYFWEKRKLKKKIAHCKERIVEVERKRMRSQASLMEAIVSHEVPSDADTDYFNRYTAQINMLRDILKDYEQELQALQRRSVNK